MEMTYELGLIGWPLGHSLSPVLHQTALIETGLKGEYCLYPVPPLPEGQATLLEIMEKIRVGALQGVNVTIPHKQSVIPHLDFLTDTALSIGAVNVIFAQDGKLAGDNTDAPGFMADLTKNLRMGLPRNVLVLGAGGSARAVIYSLLQSGCQVWCASRRLEQAGELKNDLRINDMTGEVHPIVLNSSSILPILGDCDLIVNTTSVGMFPHIENTPWPEGLDFPPKAFIYDLVYNPVETRLVSQARNAGLVAVTGLGMLVEQAALAFERWTEQPAPREAMRQAVMNFGLAGQTGKGK